MSINGDDANLALDQASGYLPALKPVARRLQRASGEVRARLRRQRGDTGLLQLFQEGSAKLRLPQVPGEELQAILINTAGGMTGGDSFRYQLTLEEGSALTISTQGCERVYRSAGGEAEVATNLVLGCGARLDWLPQETILFNGGRLRRKLEANLAASAVLLALEAVVFGRKAGGENVRAGAFRDHWRIRREGELIFADDLHFSGDIASLSRKAAVLDGNSAIVTGLLVSADAEALLSAVRGCLAGAGGASAWDGKLVFRAAAPDGFALRQIIMPAIATLRGGRPAPKVWGI